MAAPASEGLKCSFNTDNKTDSDFVFTGQHDIAYKHHRLTAPGSIVNWRFDSDGGQQDIAFKTFAPWQMADCQVSYYCNGTLLTTESVPGEDKGRTEFVFNCQLKPGQNEVTIKFIDGCGVLFLDHITLKHC